MEFVGSLGVATLLLDRLGRHAIDHGIERFTAFMLAENRPIQELIKGLGGMLERTEDRTVLTARVDLVVPERG